MCEKKISVVVPVFNPPLSSLRRCIASIYAQDGPEFELIMVDDGSVPEIARELDEVAASHTNARVIHQSNHGVSCARNVGTSAAHGDFLFYVDCDDEVVPGCFVEGMDVAERTCADIVYGYVLHDPEKHGNCERMTSCDCESVEVAVDELLMFHLKGSSSNTDLCPQKGVLDVKVGPIARFVKRELAVQVSFPTDVTMSADTIWNIGLLLKARRAVVVRSTWYLYWFTEGSAVNKYRSECAEEAVLAMGALKETMRPKELEVFLSGFINRGVGELNRIARMYARPECHLTGREKRQKLSGAYTTIFSGWSFAKLLTSCDNFATVIKVILCRTGLSLPVFKLICVKGVA